MAAARLPAGMMRSSSRLALACELVSTVSRVPAAPQRSLVMHVARRGEQQWLRAAAAAAAASAAAASATLVATAESDDDRATSRANTFQRVGAVEEFFTSTKVPEVSFAAEQCSNQFSHLVLRCRTSGHRAAKWTLLFQNGRVLGVRSQL